MEPLYRFIRKFLTDGNSPISEYQSGVVSALEVLAQGITADRVGYRLELQDFLWDTFRKNNATKEGAAPSSNIKLFFDSTMQIAGEAVDMVIPDILKTDSIPIITNLGRAHEPEYYRARLELDNLENVEGFSDNQVIGKTVMGGVNSDKFTLNIRDANGNVVAKVCDHHGYGSRWQWKEKDGNN